MWSARIRNTTTSLERICPLSRTLRYPEPSMRSEELYPCRSSADCITIMSGSDFRQGQQNVALEHRQKILRIRGRPKLDHLTHGLRGLGIRKYQCRRAVGNKGA